MIMSVQEIRKITTEERTSEFERRVLETGRTFYVHPQETWDEKTCKKWANKPRAYYGDRRSPKGLISPCSSAYAVYGKILEYNGGCVREGKWYHGEFNPLPVIDEKYEFEDMFSWGIVIKLKQ